jgi:Ca-activated chloride channel family protein
MTLRNAILIVAGALLLQARAEHPEYNDAAAEKTLAPYFEVLGGASSAAFPLQKTEVAVQVAGTIADVQVKQVYANRGTTTIEAKYVFPASTRAAVHGMEMKIGDRVIKAKIEEKSQAKATYEKAKLEHKTAALLEQKRPNVCQMNVANIAPGEEVVVYLHYSETVAATDRIYEFVFPTVVGPRYSTTTADSAQGKADEWVQNPYLAKQPAGTDLSPTMPTVDIAVDVRAGMPLQSIKCTTHETDVTFPDANTTQLTFKPGVAAQAGNRDFVLKYQLADQKVASGLLLHRGEKENFFWLTVQPPARVTPAQIPAREYLFILDVSGSMHGFPLDTAKDLVRGLIGGLGERDTFNVMLFAGAANVLSPTPLPANQANIEQAVRLIDGENARGGTNLLPALEEAFALPGADQRSRSIVLITDGFVDCEKRSFDLVRNNLGKANFFAFGIGSSVNRFLIEGLAHVGRGEPFIVLEPRDCADAAKRFREYVNAPVLTDVKLEFDGFTASSIEPPSIPDVFADRPVEVFGKWTGEPRGRIRLKGLAGNEPVSFEFDVAEAISKGAQNPALRTLWARERVCTLSDYNQLGSSSEIIREITTLGLTYELLTDYTSFVAVDETPRPQHPPLAVAQTVIQPLPLPQGVANAAVGGGTVGTTPEPGGILLVAVAAAALLLGRRRAYPGI